MDRSFTPERDPAEPENEKAKPLGLRSFGKKGEAGDDYQLDFVTPGMRPLEAISRNVIRDMRKRRK